jgi:hypothetical protein
MKVAFDVQGTLQGYGSEKIVALFKILQDQGHECYIWSFGGRMMARDCANDNGLRPQACLSKREKEYDYTEDDKRVLLEPEFDFCIDDDEGTAEILDAKKVIYVHQVPDITDTESFDTFMKQHNFYKGDQVCTVTA